ncbi:outer membrane beta-barrel protein [Mucilaginibacter sp. RCC_168]|uniref:outer membrane beta-barrel protein n=1 Tax=Mucilaginibacter sp. RCC_168 TaxID=3239221 RepID=UPI003526ACA2
MKNSLNYLNLWQKKRNELPVSDEPKQDWLAMQALLDTHLPNPVIKHNAASKIVKAIKASKTWSILSIALPAAVLVGVLAYVYIIKPKHTVPPKKHKKENVRIYKDSLLNPNPDSSNKVDSVLFKNDSTSDTKGSSSDTTDNKNELTNTGKSDPRDPSKSKPNVALLSNTRINTHNANAVMNNHNKGTSFVGGIHSASGSAVRQTTNHNQSNKTNLGTSGDPFYNQGINPMNISNKNTHVLSSSSYIMQHLVINGVFNDRNGFLTSNSANYTSTILGNNAQYSAVVNMIAKDHKKTTSSDTRIKDKSPKTKSAKNGINISMPSNIDYGVLMGVNASNSFTPKAQNSNFYGSFPVDLYAGLYSTYNFNSKFAINIQLKGLNPLRFNGSYTHRNESKIDTNQTLSINDSRKAYFVNIPIYFVYTITPNVHIKGGPVINIPVKQINGSSNYQTSGAKKDTLGYYNTVSDKLNATKYDQKLDFGFSGGIGLQYQRWMFEATYNKSFKGYHVSSDLGSYNTNPGSVQISIGFQLNKPKKQL